MCQFWFYRLGLVKVHMCFNRPSLESHSHHKRIWTGSIVWKSFYNPYFLLRAGSMTRLFVEENSIAIQQQSTSINALSTSL